MFSVATYLLTTLSKLTVFQVLLATFSCVLLTWYAQFHWNRRRLYKIASQVHGPPGLPIIGSALLFFGSPSYSYRNVMRVFDQYPGVAKTWFGHRLYYSIACPEDLEILLNNPQALHKDALYKYARKAGGFGLFAAPLPIWKRHRKFILPTFNQRILDSFVVVFAEQSTVFVEQLKKVSGKGVFDVFSYLTNCTVDIFCETALGAKGAAQQSECAFAKYTDKCLEILWLRMFYILYHFDFIFKMTKHYKEEEEAVNFIHNFTDNIIKQKKQAHKARLREAEIHPEAHIEEKTRKAFLDFLIEENHKGAKFTDEELRDEADTFMIAGTDTTATTNCFVFLMLGMHPDVQQRVYEEVIDVLGPERMIEASDIPKFKYLERVIKESMRLFPVAPIIVRELAGDIQLTSCMIPKGASVVVGIQHMHKNPQYWPNPDKFDPDRFLPEEMGKRHSYAYMPFSAGPRNCIGIKYAMMAITALVATVVRRYEIRTQYKTVNEVTLKANVILRPCEGFKLSVDAR